LAGFVSVIADNHVLAWFAIAAADLYLFGVLLCAAILSDDDEFAKQHEWLRFLFPRRTAGLFMFALLMFAIISGFAGLYVGTNVFPSSNTPLDALYISFFTMGFNDYSPKPGYGQLGVSTFKRRSLAIWSFSAAALRHLDVRAPVIQVDKQNTVENTSNLSVQN
jgi:hypothetical protein